MVGASNRNAARGLANAAESNDFDYGDDDESEEEVEELNQRGDRVSELTLFRDFKLKSTLPTAFDGFAGAAESSRCARGPEARN